MSEDPQSTSETPTGDKPALVVEFPLHEISHSMNRGLQRLVDCTALSLAGANRVESIDDLRLSGQFTRFDPASNVQLPLDQLKNAHRSWILANCFREAVERVQHSLAMVKRFSQFREFQKTGGTVDELRQCIDVGRSFDRLPLDQKLQWIADTYGSVGLSEAVLSINAARNCLTHRGGIVSPTDCDRGEQSLTVKWRKMAIIATSPDGAERELLEPSVVETGTSVGVRQTDGSKTFALGERN